MPKVWVTQEMPKFNYTGAEVYGEVRFITNEEYSPMQGSLLNMDLSRGITDTLKDFDYDADYIVPTGSPIVVMAVMAVLGRKAKKFRILKWDNREYVYVPMRIDI